jgi:uroporphyrinogen-III synthase
LQKRILASVKARAVKKTSTLLYLAGADLARDLAGELGAHGLTVVTQTTYRMAAVRHFPEQTRDAFATNGVEAVLHYSRRSARAFVEAVQAAGVEVSALALRQYCLSGGIATVLRDAGAMQVVVAASPDEKALFAALERS